MTTEVELPLAPSEFGGWRVKETATHYVDLVPMIYNTRIVTIPKDNQTGYDRGWCYPRFDAAMLAAIAWDPEVSERPVGWIKEAHTGLRPNVETY
jgi:hypothetical protein